jgi:hypothetical protein
MFKRRKFLFVLMLFLMILSACAPKTVTPGPQPASADQNTQSPSGGLVTKDKAPFALAAKATLGQKLGIAPDQITFVSADPVEWTDSCLGLGGPAESCMQAVTPGYKVMLSAQGTSFEVHTDEAGSIVRIKE